MLLVIERAFDLPMARCPEEKFHVGFRVQVKGWKRCSDRLVYSCSGVLKVLSLCVNIHRITQADACAMVLAAPSTGLS